MCAALNIVFDASVPRRADVVEEHLALGLLNGGLLGGGLLVEGREAGRLRFRRIPSFFDVPDSGELLIEGSAKGETRVRFELACCTMRLRSGALGVLVALAVAALTLRLGPPWWAVCAGAAVLGLVVAVFAWTAARRRLVGRARAFTSSARYLKSF